MDIMKNLDLAIKIIINPKSTFEKIKTEKVTKQELLIYLAIVGFPSFLGFFIAKGILEGGGAFLVLAFVISLLKYALSIAGIFAFGYIINILAPYLKSTQNIEQSLKLVGYASTPWLLFGILIFIPTIAILTTVFSLYAFVILYFGFPVMMDTPKEWHIPFFIIGAVLYFVVIRSISEIVYSILYIYI